MRKFFPYFKKTLKRSTERENAHVNWAIIASYIGLTLTIGSLYFTSQNLKETEKWNKASFIANQFEKFGNDTSVAFVTHFLDYEIRRVKINQKTMFIDKDLISVCLLPDSLSGGADPNLKAAVRDNFDNYLDKLSLFNRYYKAGLMTFDDIQPYLDYNMAILIKSNDRHDDEFHEALFGYIRRYHFTDVSELVDLFKKKEGLKENRKFQ